MGYFVASEYFKQGLINNTIRNMSDQQVANYNLANLICQIPKRQLISDGEFLAKKLNINFVSNYVKI